MPFWDRYWWLRSLLALALGAATAFAAARVWLAPGDFGLDLGDVPARVALAVAIFGLLALTAVGIWRAGLLARRRKRLRLAAIAGPPPLLTASSSPPLDAPIALLWRHSWFQIARTLFQEVLLLYWLGVALTLALPPLLGVQVPGVTPKTLDRIPPGVSLAALVLLVALLAGWWWLLRRPWGVIARDDGLTFRRRLGRPRSVRWDDLRLLEQRYESKNSEHYQTYLLYSTHGVGRWYIKGEERVQSIVPVGATPDEMRQRAIALESLLRQRAGLLPRRIDIEAQQLPYTQPEGILQLRLRGNLGCLAWLLLIALGCGALLVVAPLSSDDTFNWIVGVSLPGALVLAAVPLALGALARRLRGAGAHGTRFSEGEELPEPPGWVYEVRTETRWDERMSFLLVGLVGLVGLLPPLVQWFPDPLAALVPGWQVTISDPFGTMATLVLLCWGLFAVLMLLIALFSRVEIIRADATGLTKLRGRRVKAHIAWRNLQKLAPNTSYDRLTMYEAVGNRWRTRISWQAVSVGTRYLGRGRYGVTPAQLFALAMKHSGVAPSTHATEESPTVMPPS